MDVSSPAHFSEQVKQLMQAYEQLRTAHAELKNQHQQLQQTNQLAQQQVRQMIHRLKMIEDQA